MKLFNQISLRRPKKSKFDLSHEKKMSLQMGKLTPILVQDILPGDSFRVRSELFLRMAPMLAPIMHRVNVYTHYFFVPNRIVWNEWEDFITGGKDGTLAPLMPVIGAAESTKQYFGKGSLADYFGIPVIPAGTTVTTGRNVSALPFRAYTQIYNDYFRDQNLEDEIDFSKASGNSSDDMAKIGILRNRAWEKDYFTSCLPFAQRGPEVSMNIEYGDGPTRTVGLGSGVDKAVDGTLTSKINPSDPSFSEVLTTGDSNELIRFETEAGITINELRRSARLQEWLENNARGGARYVEQLLSHFGVIADDARLQRAEYLGGGRAPMSISEVLQTSGTGNFDQGQGEPYTKTPQGQMAGHGIAASGSNGFKKKFKEHGYVIGLMSILPKTAYQQGIEKHWLRTDKLDFGWPEFANLGEQEVQRSEVFQDWTAADSGENSATFGYQSRYAEYKYKSSTVAGDFRDNLSYWHMGRIFENAPALNASFVQADPTKRIFAVEDEGEDEIYCQCYHSIDAVRPLPYFGTPRL